MKRHLAAASFALALCALPGSALLAHAQGADAIVPVAVESIGGSVAPERASVERLVAARASVIDLSPVMRAASPASAAADRASDLVPSPAGAALQGRDWKMPTSRTLMIGGTAAAIVGLALIGGDAGAIVAMAGGGVAVYGLYLHYNR